MLVLWQYVQYNSYALYRSVIIKKNFVSLTFHVLPVLLQLFLTNLQNILTTKTKDHQLVLHMASIPVSMLLCCWLSLHILKSLSIIRQNMAVPAELVGKNGDKNSASNGFSSHVKAVVLLTFIACIEKFIHNYTEHGRCSWACWACWQSFTDNCVYSTLVQLPWHSWQSMMYLV